MVKCLHDLDYRGFPQFVTILFYIIFALHLKKHIPYQMSIIQTIREKGAVIVIALIALSLIAFILMDSRSRGVSGLFGGSNTTTIGSVNGDKIEYSDFTARVKDIEQQYQNSSGADDQIRQNVWDQMVSELLLNQQFEDLGISFTPKEMSSIMFSDDAPAPMKQQFTDKQTGIYDIGKAQQWWAQVKKIKNEDQRRQVDEQLIEPMRLNSLYTKYISMIAASVYVPSWLSKEQQEEKNSFANVSYVAIPYSTISDSTIKVTDDDIKTYIDKNKLKYKQDPGRIISYVSFSINPSSKDTAAAKQAVETLTESFKKDSNAAAFIARNSSSIPFFDGYTAKTKLQMPFKDSIIALPDGGVFGPYLDRDNYVLAKKIATKILPDSIKCRHILIGTNNPQTGEQLMPDSVAKKLADSISVAIKNGANFDSLEAKYSTDKAAHEQKGVMTFDLSTIEGDNFAKEFADFLLNEKGETKGVVKTQFGWHYIEILEKKNPGPAYKVAYMAKQIVASDETINTASAAATKLSGQARDKPAYDKYVAQNGLKEIDVPGIIKENDYQLGGLQDARQIIKWAFDAKQGDVSDPFSTKDAFVVAVLDKIIKEGPPDVETARPLVEPLIRNIKKAEEITKKLNNPTSLDAAAKTYNQQVLTTGADSTLTFDAQLINGVGNEPKVAGASFDKEFQTKISPAIEGNTGVFVIKINSIGKKAAMPQAVIDQQKMAEQSREQQSAVAQSFSILKKIATIKDNRSKFF